MSLKEKYPWFKHIDFILIDLFCLVFSFILSFYLKMDRIDFWKEQKWKLLLIMICFVNLIVMFGINPYSGILKRRYYIQLNKEVFLCIYQFFIICVLFYALKIGTNLSREMLFTTYGIYFVLSQTIKYTHKKILIGKLLHINIKEKIKQSNKNYSESIHVNNSFKKIFGKIIKRTIDIIAGLIGVIILFPIIIIIFIFNRLYEEDGPIFFVQDRIGKNGKLFKMIKFRTMCVDADEKLQEFLNANPDIKSEFMVYRKIKNDPRITKTGQFLRKTSLDEWPQFLNILKGEMTLVGPRPYLPREKDSMGNYYSTIIKDTPGLTGFWQTEGRSNVTFEDRLEMDFKYHQNKSLKQDFWIIVKTIGLVLKKSGAI